MEVVATKEHVTEISFKLQLDEYSCLRHYKRENQDGNRCLNLKKSIELPTFFGTFKGNVLIFHNHAGNIQNSLDAGIQGSS